jgi:hypothetical protein
LREGFCYSYYYCSHLRLSSFLLGTALTACSKLAEVEHREWSLTSENEGLKKDLEGAHTARDVAVKNKEMMQQAKKAKLQ